MRTSDIKLEISAVRAAKIVAVIAAVALAVTMSPQLTHAGYFGPRVEQYTTAEEGHSVEIEVSVYVYGGDTWEATEYTIEGGSTVCVDHDDHTSGRTVEALPATAPASAGLYDIDVDFYDTDDCSGPVVASASETDGMIVVDPNPDQADGCGLDIVLILDESGSIDSGGITGDVRDGAEALVGALVGTGSNLAVVEFNSNARRAEIRVDGVTFSTNWQTVDSQYVTDFTYYMEAYESASARSYDPGDYSSPNFYTNWEAALAAVNDAFYDSSGDPTGPTGEPPLVLFFTDGDPTAYIDSNGDVQVNQSAKTSLIEAVPESDELKSNGSHIFVVAVEQSPGAVNEINVRGISGMDEFPSPESDFTKADYNILSGTSGLIDALTDMVTALCETSLTLTKYVHTGSDLGYVAASGWTVSGEVEITETGESYDDYEWTDPVQGTAGSPDNEGTTQSGSTGAGGTFFWQWVPHTVDDPAPEWDSSIEINETMQTGYTFDGGSCTVTTPTGSSTTTFSTLPYTVDFTAANTYATCSLYNKATFDIQIVTTCYDWEGTTPYTIANDTVSHDTLSTTTATGVTIVHELDAGATYNSFYVQSTPGGTTSCSSDGEESGETVTCTLTGDFDPTDADWSVDIIVDYPGGPEGTITNVATVSANETEIDTDDNQDTCGSTVPVTLSYFEATRSADSVRFEWSTATEAGNVGFNLYVDNGDGWTRINDQLIPSHAIDSLERQDYDYVASGITGDTFRIEDVNIFAEPQVHGEFSVGEPYGARVAAEPIDWPAIRAESDLKADARRAEQLVTARSAVAMADVPSSKRALDLPGPQAADATSQSLAVATTAGDEYADCEVQVGKDGVYRLTYEHLRDTCADLRGVALTDIALTVAGEPVPIIVEGRRFFGPGSYVEFVGHGLDTLYTDDNVYTLTVDRSLAERIKADNSSPHPSAQPEPFYTATETVSRQNGYSFSSPLDDPWYDTLMLVVGGPKTFAFGFDLPDLVPGAAASELDVTLWGGSDLPEQPDHHVVVDVNGNQVGDAWFDGVREASVQSALNGAGLAPAGNTLELTLPVDTGLPWDAAYLEGFSVAYPRAFVASGGALTFESAGSMFEVGGLPDPDVSVLRVEDGEVRMLSRVSVAGAPGSYAATFAGTGNPATYYVTSNAALLDPLTTPAALEADITSHPADLLVISHPDFVAGLAPLVQARQAQGLVVEVVDVDQVYEQFGHAVFDPQAIKDYIAYAAANKGIEYVLLVGGDTYDYKDYLGQGAVGFIPSLYARTDYVVGYAPVDPLYTDVDGDSVPDLPIGRLPVRTSAELDAIVGKILAYDAKSYEHTAVFAADAGDGTSSFASMSNMLADELPGAWNVNRAYIDEVGVKAAKQRIIDAINSGVAMTSFFGHSSADRWTFSGLFHASDAASLSNAGRPTVVTQWGCWNTYFVSPSYNTLAHKFMLSGDRGAAAVLGASTLTGSSNERALGVRTIPLVAQPGLPIGLAIQQAKDDLAATHPDAVDVLLGWTLLGDPTMVISQ